MVLSKIFVLNNFVTLHSMFDPGIRGVLTRVRCLIKSQLRPEFSGCFANSQLPSKKVNPPNPL